MEKEGKKALKHEDKMIIELTLRMMAEAAINAGKLDTKGKTDREILSDLKAFVKQLPNNFIIMGTTDHLVYRLTNSLTHRERRCAAPARRASEGVLGEYGELAQQSWSGCSGARMPRYL